MSSGGIHRAASSHPPRRAALGVPALLATLGLLIAMLTIAAPVTGATNVGFLGPSTAGAGTAPTGQKPESKLWIAGGSWWGVLYAPGGFRIHRLDRSTETWVDTGVTIDTRSSSRADTLWTGSKLYVATHVSSTSPAVGYPSRLLRFTYDAAAQTYRLDAGFPVTINDERSESLVIDRDGTGTLWATWVRGGRVWVARTLGSDTQWSAPFTPAVKGSTTLSSDDISSVIAFGPGKIGVMWSNQRDSAMYFAVHVDGAAADVWDGSRTAIQGPNDADDHINLKSLQSDGSGRVFAAVKSSQTSSAAPLIRLLVRSASGDWDSHTFGRVSDHHTRPIVLLDTQHGILHMFATSGESGGTIYEKTTPISSIDFASGLGTPAIRDGSSPDLNNATSTKQNVDGSTGLVVLASNDSTGRYWFADLSLGGGPQPTPTPTPGATPTATPPPGGTRTFAASADAKTNSTKPTSNYGTTTTLQVRNGSSDGLATYRTYVRFPVSGLSAAPSGVALRLSVSDATRNDLRVSAVSSAWSETGITAGNAPATGALRATLTGGAAVGTITITLPASSVSGNGDVSFVIESSGTDSLIATSREGGSAPQLLVVP
jgi:hypothetical protein